MKERFTLRLEGDLLEKIKIQAIKEKRNVNEIAEELFKKYLKEKKVLM